MESLRRVYGMAEPIRRGMELKIVRDSSFTPMMLGGPRRNGGNLHEDILVLGGRDAEFGWEDVFHGRSLCAVCTTCTVCAAAALSLSLSLHMNITNVKLPGDEFREPPSFHDEMEKRLKMDW